RMDLSPSPSRRPTRWLIPTELGPTYPGSLHGSEWVHHEGLTKLPTQLPTQLWDVSQQSVGLYATMAPSTPWSEGGRCARRRERAGPHAIESSIIAARGRGVMAIAAPLTFGQLLKRHRLAAGLTQEALAMRAGMSVRSISDLERGLRRIPYKDTIERLAQAL